MSAFPLGQLYNRYADNAYEDLRQQVQGGTIYAATKSNSHKMPTTTKRSYKRRYTRKRRSYRTKYAKKNKRTGGYVGLEVKFFDTVRTPALAMGTVWSHNSPTAPGPLSVCISSPIQGIGESGHSGRVYWLKNIVVRFRMKYDFEVAQTSPFPDEEYRIIVVLDKQTNSAAALGTEVMDAGGSDDLSAYRNLQNSHRFRVLYDSGIRIVPLANLTQADSAGKFAHGEVCQRLEMAHEFKTPVKVRTDATPADIASITDFSISVYSVCTNIKCLLAWESRCRFYA